MQYQICRKYAQYAQMNYAKYASIYKICKSQICNVLCFYMQMQKYAKLNNMHKYAFLKYA